jgi:hypothetical protein
MRWKISLFLSIALPIAFSVTSLAGCGKDDDNATGPEVPSRPDPATAPPTTQQLLSGDRTELDVKFAPITLKVPSHWEVKSYSDGSMVTIEGPTPTDVAGISVPVYHTITNDQEISLENQAKKDLAVHPELLQHVGIRNIPGGKVIERLVVDPVLPVAVTGTTQPLQTVQWTFSVCIPAGDGKNFNVYDLRFLGLTLSQYKTDQSFLRTIIDSLNYTPSDLFPK